jgi:hypothetical protein
MIYNIFHVRRVHIGRQKILMLRLREVFVLIILDLRLDKCVQLY